MKYVKLGMLCALAMALSFAERFIPVNGAVPGGKLGLANIVTLIVLNLYGFLPALSVTAVRCVLGAFLYGGVSSLPYSLSGGVLSLIVMFAVMKIPHVSNTGTAVAGAFAHNTAQVLTAMVIMQNGLIINYLWPLGILSVGAGAFTGICSSLCLKYLNKTQKGEVGYEG